MGAVKEFLSMIVDNVLVSDACLLGKGRIIDCVNNNPEAEELADYSMILPSSLGYVFLVYRRGSDWVTSLIPLGRDFWLLIISPYHTLLSGKNFYVLLKSLSDMSFRVGSIILGNNKKVSVVGDPSSVG